MNLMNFNFLAGLMQPSMIQSDPGWIIGPISTVFGYIIDFIYQALAWITPVNALGFSIIIMTMIIRGGLVPSQLKMQQNSRKTQIIKPEMDKIRAKYGDTKDPELRRKMSAEIQALNQKHGINMMASCLPMLVTMPIFIALFAVFGRAFLFIPSITEAYSVVSQAVIDLGPTFYRDVVMDLVRAYVPSGMEIHGHLVEDLNRALHVFNDTDWNVIFGVLEGQTVSEIYNNYGVTLRAVRDGVLVNLTQTDLEFALGTVGNSVGSNVAGVSDGLNNLRLHYDEMRSIQTFFGLNLVAPSGIRWPGVIIPVLSVLSMVYSSWQMAKMNPATDQQAKMMQRVTMFVLPVMFGWFTISAAAAVGLYWTAGNIFLIAQNLVVHKFFPHKTGAVLTGDAGGKAGK
jgi:YidC/Oxa1 family membrane protein insertase